MSVRVGIHACSDRLSKIDILLPALLVGAFVASTLSWNDASGCGTAADEDADIDEDIWFLGLVCCALSFMVAVCGVCAGGGRGGVR